MSTDRHGKKALITGITGQDGAYLAEFLLAKGYEVHGVKRRASSFNTDRIDHLYRDPHDSDRRMVLHYGDLTDATNLIRIVQEVQPDEIYNLAAQSHVAVSFETAEYTANADALGTLRLLEAIRICGLGAKTRFYQASSSEMFGKVVETPQRETTPFYPRSPYGAAKVYAYWITVNYREAYGLFACNGILFNHEGPTRGETFVTRKITRAVGRIKLGLQSKVYLGNLDAQPLRFAICTTFQRKLDLLPQLLCVDWLFPNRDLIDYPDDAIEPSNRAFCVCPLPPVVHLAFQCHPHRALLLVAADHQQPVFAQDLHPGVVPVVGRAGAVDRAHRAAFEAEADDRTVRLLWRLRRQLSERVAYGKTQLERGLQWWEYSMFFSKRFRIPLSLVFAYIGTHNHFVLDRGGKVFDTTHSEDVL